MIGALIIEAAGKERPGRSLVPGRKRDNCHRESNHRKVSARGAKVPTGPGGGRVRQPGSGSPGVAWAVGSSLSAPTYTTMRLLAAVFCEKFHVLSGGRRVSIALETRGWLRQRMRRADSRRDFMDYPLTGSASEEDIPANALLVDSAIGHCEKLRRVLELEEWAKQGRDNPMLAAPCRKWQE